MSQPYLSVTTRVSSSFNVATYITLPRHKSFFEVLLLSQQAFPCCNNQYRDRRGFCRDRDFAFCSSFCCNINLSVVVVFLYCSLISCRDRRYLVTTEFLPSYCFICSDRSFFVAIISSHFLSRHAVFCRDRAHLSIFKSLCCNKGNIVVTEFLFHFLRSLLRHKKLCRDRDCCNCSFSLLSCWNFFLFELKPAKHKVGKYSIIRH